MASADTRDNFKVVIKSRPLIKRERDARQPVLWKIEGNCIESISPNWMNQRYTFDHIYDENSTTLELYNDVARPIVEKSVKGFNGTIFAYGQTSSGKTYTMLGDKKNIGVIRLAARQIFNDIMHQTEQSGRTFIVKVNYLEIYNEKVYDLLNDRKEIKIQELPNGELKFGCTGRNAVCDDDILKLVEIGNNHRKVAETNMNVQSSRSHAILQIGIESVLDCDGASQVSVLNLVDLAGSERADSTGATGERLKEAGNINKSLLTLSIVINKLSEDPDGHIGYRDSKLTRILQTSLGGNAMTVMICAITPAACEETNLTLGFATRAKKIENKPVINETVSDAVEVKRAKKLIIQLEAQLALQSKEIAAYQKKERELKMLKQITIQAPNKESKLPLRPRRRTWAPNTDSTLSPLPKIAESDIEDEKNSICHLAFTDLGRQVECTDDDWGSFLNDTLGRQIVDFDAEEFDSVQPKFKFSNRPASQADQLRELELDELNSSSTRTPKQSAQATVRRSLLKTPKSLKQILNEKNDSIIASSIASPIALDKDKRIRMLEEELEELRHFQQTETMLNRQWNLDELQAELDGKSIEIDRLNQQLNEASKKIQDIQSQFELAECETKEAKKEKSLAIQAKVVAEQYMTSIEYQYEQHKIRADRREKELIEQLDNLNNDIAMKMLKEKLAVMTEKVTTLETQLWQDAHKHKDEIEMLNVKYSESQKKFERVAIQADKLKSLQNEYDEVSAQLVDVIQENDEYKSKSATLHVTIDNLNEEISDLKAKLSTVSVNSNSEDEIKIQQLKENYRKDLESLEATNAFLAAQIEKLQQTITDQSSELQKLEGNCHDDLIDGKQIDQPDVNKELEQIINEQKEEILKLKIEHDDLLAHYINLEHTNNMLENACTQARMTVDFILKETDVLCKGYNDLKLKIYEQEIEQLKLQKTLCEYDESFNFSTINDTHTSLMTNTPLSSKPTRRSIGNKRRSSIYNNTEAVLVEDEKEIVESAKNDLVIQLQKAKQERDNYATQLEMIIKRLSTTLEDELSSKLNGFSIDDQMLDRLVANFNELKDMKEKCNQLESAKEKNEQLISMLRSESQNLTEQLELLQTEQKQLKDQLETEKSNNVQSTQIIVDLNQKLADHKQHDELVNKQIEDLNDLKAKQRTEITRLQQMVSLNSDSGAELAKITKEIEMVNEKLQNALVENETLNTECESLKKLLIAKEQEIIENELLLTDLKKSIEDFETSKQTAQEEFQQIQQELTHKLAEMETELRDVKNKHDLVQKELQEKERKIVEFQEEIASHEHNKEQDQQSFLARIDALKVEIEMLKTSLSAKVQELKANEHQITELQMAIENYRTSKQTDQEKLGKIQQELSDKLVEKEAELQKSMDEITQLKNIVDKYEQSQKDAQDSLLAQNDVLKTEIESTKIKTESLKIENKSLKNEIESTKFETESLKIENQFLKNEIESTKIETESLKIENKSLKNEIEMLKTETESLKTSFNAKEQELKANELQLVELKIVIEKYEKSKQIAQAEFERIQRELADKEAEFKEIVKKHKLVQEETQENLTKNELKINKLNEVIANHVRVKTQDDETLKCNDSEIKQLNSLVKQLTDQLCDLKADIKVATDAKEQELNKMRVELLNKYDEKMTEIQKYTNEIAQLKATIDKYKISNKETQQSLIENERNIAELQETIANNERTKKQEQEELKKIEKELKDRLTLKEKQFSSVTNEIAELKEIIANYERMTQDNKMRFGELQHRITVLEEEQECLEKLNVKLRLQVDNHTEEMNGVQSRLATMKLAKEKLEFEKQKLTEEMNAIQNKRHGPTSGTLSDSFQTHSPRRRDKRNMDIDSLLNENQTLKMKQSKLENEVAELRQSTSTVRKIKRQSFHDDTRRISGFDSTMIDIGTQTDPIDEMCACNDMAKQIKKLKEEVVIIEARYATFKRSTGVDELQAEVKTLKAELLTTKSKLSRLTIDYENLLDKHEKVKLKSLIAQQKPLSKDATMQTDLPKSNPTFVDQMDWERANRRAEKYKTAYEVATKEYDQFKTKLEEIKLELDEKSKKCIETAKLLDEIQPKYSNMKRICNYRWDQIEEYKKKIADFEKNELKMKSELDDFKTQLAKHKEITEELARYKRKYETAKNICDSRRLEIERLNKLLKQPNNENVPVN